MKIGIVGGIGPESTLDYYKSIISGYRKEIKDGSYPRIIIDSIDMKEMLEYVAGKEWDALATLLYNSIKALSYGGAEIAVIASNTPHVVFDRVKDLSPIPLLSIVEETCNMAKKMNLARVGLLGTAFTMRENFYKDCFSEKNMEIILPKTKEQEYINEKLFSEIEHGIIKEDTKSGFISIINKMIIEEAVEGVILGCTEIPLILKEGDCSIPFLNTVDIHVQSIIKNCFLKSE